MAAAGELARTLYEAYQRRDWEADESVLHRRAVVSLPATAERLEGRAAIMAFNRSYPEPWGTLTVERVVVEGDQAAAEVSVVEPDGTRFAMAAFWNCRDGLLHEGVEHWVTLGGEQPPADRRPG